MQSVPDSYETLIRALETMPEEALNTGLVKNKLLEKFKRKSKANSTHNNPNPKVLKTIIK